MHTNAASPLYSNNSFQSPAGGDGVSKEFFIGLERQDLNSFLYNLLEKKISQKKMTEAQSAFKNKKYYNSAEVRKEVLRRGYQYSSKARRLAFSMCKGGVGKTTLSYFLGLRLASYGARVLFVDSDPQGNLTLALRLKEQNRILRDRLPVLVDVLAKRIGIRETILKVSNNLHVIPSTAVNSMLERDLLNLRSDPIRRLDFVLQAVDKDYDYIITDCAPTLNIFNASVAFASDMLILPFQLNEFSKSGVTQTISEIHDLEKQFLFKTEIKAILNFYTPSDSIGRGYLQSFGAAHKSLFMQSVIRHSADVQKVFAYGEDFFQAESSWAKEDFNEFAVEILMSSFKVRERYAENG